MKNNFLLFITVSTKNALPIITNQNFCQSPFRFFLSSPLYFDPFPHPNSSLLVLYRPVSSTVSVTADVRAKPTFRSSFTKQQLPLFPDNLFFFNFLFNFLISNRRDSSVICLSFSSAYTYLIEACLKHLGLLSGVQLSTSCTVFRRITKKLF